MCSPAQLATLLAAVSEPPTVVRRKYMLLLAERFNLPSLVEALDEPKDEGLAARKRRYSLRLKDLKNGRRTS